MTRWSGSLYLVKFKYKEKFGRVWRDRHSGELYRNPSASKPVATTQTHEITRRLWR